MLQRPNGIPRVWGTMLRDPGPARGEGDPGDPLRLLPPTSRCGRSSPGGLRGCRQEFSSPRQREDHRPFGPASPGTWARETDSGIPAVRGFSRVLSLPQTGCLQESEIFLPVLQRGKRRHQQSDAPSHPGPRSIAPRVGRKPAVARNVQGMLQRSQIGHFSESAPKSELGSTRQGPKRGFRYHRARGNPAKGLQVAGEGHRSVGPSSFRS